MENRKRETEREIGEVEREREDVGEDVDERMMAMSSEDGEEVETVIAAIREEEDPALGVSAATAADHLVVENDPSSSQQLKPRKRKYDE